MFLFCISPDIRGPSRQDLPQPRAAPIPPLHRHGRGSARAEAASARRRRRALRLTPPTRPAPRWHRPRSRLRSRTWEKIHTIRGKKVSRALAVPAAAERHHHGQKARYARTSARVQWHRDARTMALLCYPPVLARDGTRVAQGRGSPRRVQQRVPAARRPRGHGPDRRPPQARAVMLCPALLGPRLHPISVACRFSATAPKIFQQQHLCEQ